MSIPKRLSKCPAARECSTGVVFQDEETGNLYRFDERTKKFIDHKCSTRNASEAPKLVFLGEWYNKETGRTRYLGPERMRKSVERAPNDEAYRKRGSNPAWVHKQTFIAELDWKPVKD